MEQLRQEKSEIDQQLRSIQGSTMGSMQSLSMSRRSDRGGYNSDMDGGRGRGQMRGRGGRGRGDRGRHDRYNTGTISNSHDYDNNVTTNGRPSRSANSRGNGAAGAGGGGNSGGGGRSYGRAPPPAKHSSNDRSLKNSDGGGGREKSSRKAAVDAAGGGDREQK